MPKLELGARWGLAAMLSMSFMYQADATIVNVALPSIRDDLGASSAQLELVIGGYLLASATLLILGARLGHLAGYRRVFLAGVALFGLASLLCGLAPNPLVLIAMRVLQGIGGALAVPQVMTGIQLQFAPGPERTRALGLQAIALSGGAVAGQLLGGLLGSFNLFGLHWRPIFLINVPIAVAVIGIGLLAIPGARTTDRTQRLDVPGATVLSATVLTLVLPLTVGRDAGWPLWTWLCLAASAGFFAIFLAVESRRTRGGGSPLFDMSVVTRPSIAWGLLSQSLMTATYYALLFTLAQYLQHGLGRSALFSGLILIPWVVAFGVPGRLLPHVPGDRQRMVPHLGCLVVVLAYLGLSAMLFADSRSPGLMVALLAVGGLGLGASYSGMVVHLTTTATPRHAADISGVFMTSLQIAGAIGVAAFGAFYLNLTTRHTTDPSRQFAFVCVTFAVTALLGAAAARFATRARTESAAPVARSVQTESVR
ncbi:MFS transporter [Nocardia sp. NPDC046763]|uniref:MFS transporter n=1 Tax=Nocardia sp. NPDC046763 TaxID=3155256 RepID=UPI0033EC3206